MDIKVNDTDWNGLTEDERENIKNIITNIFKQDHQIVAEKAQSAAGSAQLGSFCTIACDIAEKAAELACNAIPNPIAKQVCVLAAQQAGNFCRSKC